MDLMDSVAARWNWEVINTVFNERDQTEIRKILPSSQEAEDELI